MEATGADPRRWGFVLLAAVAVVALVVGLMAWPIVPHDTDFYYHLNYGRRIAATGAVPATAWYSYVPTREFVDYYWLTQLVFYLLFAAFGPIGLIALRTALFVGLAASVSAIVARSPLARAGSGRAGLVTACVLLIALQRYSAPRPHMFSYLFLAASIALIERGGRALWALIPIAVLWVNLHGVEYPVLLVVLGGALADRISAWRSRPVQREAALLCAAALCVLATPFGPGLLHVPFMPLQLLSLEIFELMPATWSGLTSFGVHELVPNWSALRAVMIGLAAVSLISEALRRTITPRHLVWTLGGFYLLGRIERFGVEFALLALPLIAHAGWLAELRPQVPRWLRGVGLGLAAALVVACFAELTRGPWRYPLEQSVLPQGTASLLRSQAPAGGRVLAHPNFVGYLEWTLGDRFAFGPDIQTPFVFDATRVLEFGSAYAEPQALRSAAERWRADYVLVPWSGLASLGQGLGQTYAAIGFDDVVVAYAHRQRCAGLVAKAELRALAPESVGALLRGQLPPERIAPVAAELERLRRFGGATGVVSAAQAIVAQQRGARDAARAYARTAAALAPSQLEILRVAGEVLLATGAAAEALPYFTRGLALVAQGSAPPPTRSALARGAAQALSELGRAPEAYALLLPVLGGITSSSISAADLELLAAAAGDAAEPAAASTLSELARLRRGRPP